MPGGAIVRLSAAPQSTAISARSGIRIALTSRKFPDAKRVAAEDQLAVLRRIEIQHLVYELQLFVHREFPSRLRIAGAPDQLFAAELFIDGFEKRVGVAIRELFGQRKLVRFR